MTKVRKSSGKKPESMTGKQLKGIVGGLNLALNVTTDSRNRTPPKKSTKR